MRKSTAFSDGIGFLMGFFLGCCGLMLSVLFFRDTLRGVLLGIGARMLLGIVVSVVGDFSAPGSIPLIRPDGSAVTNDIPWELVAAFGIGTVAVAVIGAAGVWAFGGSSDDDDDEPPPPENHTYVTYSR